MRRAVDVLRLAAIGILFFSGPGAHAAATDTVTAASIIPGSTSANNPLLTVGMLDTLVNPLDVFALQQTVRDLARSLPQYRWRIVTITAAEAVDEINRLQPDFLFAPAGFFALVQKDEPQRFFHIATRKPPVAQDTEHAVGAVFVVRSDRTDLNSLSALRGKTTMTALPDALDGWMAAAGEIAAQGHDPENFFSSVSYRNNAYPDVLSALLARQTEVGIMPACLLETLGRRRLADPSQFRVVATKTDTFACRHSTALYPDISFLALPHATETAVRKATIALLSQGDSTSPTVGSSGTQWVTNATDASVLELYRTLKVGPYAYLRDTSVSAFVSRHRVEILSAVLLLLFLLANEFRLVFLVRKKTAQLRHALRQRDHWEARAAEVRGTLLRMERRSTLEQMSGMIAHEVNAPVGSIRTYVKVLDVLRTQGRSLQDGAVGEAFRGIHDETQRLSDIISRVRQYARTQNTPHVPCDLAQILHRAVSAFTFERSLSTEKHIRLAVAVSPATVSGDSLELEILFVNLLRNAYDAMMEAVHRHEISPHSYLSVTLRRAAEKAAFIVVIDNPGRPASDQDIARLSALSSAVSTKPAGLGLGLTICRGIADSHGASLRFTARPEGGIRTIFTIDELQQE